MDSLRDRVAVVTGAASGIGRALAERFAADGARLVLSDVDEAAVGDLAKALEAGGAEVMARHTDVSRAEDVEALGEAAWDRFGAVHVVANNAGVAVTGSVWENTLEELRWVVDVNLFGVLHGLRTFVPRMIAGGDEGHVVNVASMAGLTSSPFLSIYNATKHAVVTLSESLHKELVALGAERIGVSVVCPGLIRTRIMDADRYGSDGAETRAAELGPGTRALDQLMRAGVDAGWPPSAVADEVASGIRERRFYVLPAQDEIVAQAEVRLDDVRARRNPTFAAPGG